MNKLISGLAFTFFFIFVLSGTITNAEERKASQEGEEVTKHTRSEVLADKVAGILFEASAKGKIKVLILDFSASSINGENKLPEGELKDLGTRYTEEFTADIINKIKDAEKRDKISIIDRSRLDDILREKKLPVTDISERTALETAGIAGLDVIITGKVYVGGGLATAMTKVIRVKDSEILGIAKQEGEEKPSPLAHKRITLINDVEKIKIGTWKALPLNLASGGIITVSVNVLSGNPIDVRVIPGTDMENFKNQTEYNAVVSFMARKRKSYKQSVKLSKGDYYLILRDSSVGIFSKESSDIRITLEVEP
jgi:hypothetical protein